MQLGSPEGDDQESGFSVKLHGRTYPSNGSANDIADPLTNSRMANASRETLMLQVRSRIHIDELRRITSTAELTEVYVTQMQTLHRLRQDIDDLIPLLCEANLVFRQQADTTVHAAKEEILAAKRQEMIERANLRLRLPKNIVDAHLLALPPETASARLIASLEENVNQFVSDFFSGLDRLVDQQVAGLVEWTSQNTCCYHFFREVVIQEKNVTTKELGDLHRSKDCPQGWDITANTTLRSTHTHRIARHEHHTTDAFQTTIADSEVVMPSEVRQFVDRIPEWLAPIVRIIDGKIAREIIVEKDLHTEDWEQTETRDIPVFGSEPAVVIDQVVLTGWGPREIESELDRRGSSRPRANKKRPTSVITSVYFTIGAVVSALSLSLFWQAVGNILAVTFAFAISLLAVPCWFAGFDSRAKRSGGNPASNQRSWIAAFGATTVTVGLGILLSFGSSPSVTTLTAVTLLLAGTGLIALPPLLFPNQK